ncbi:MAG: acyl carrier protein [Paracoccaceae bacterium]
MLTATEAEIAAIVVAVGRIGAEGLRADTPLSALGLDSVTMVEIVFAVEERFDIAIPLDIDTAPLGLGDLARLVETLKAQAR